MRFSISGDSRPLTKGRDIVNVFRNRDVLLGAGEASAFSAAWEVFLSLAAKLRRELGDRQYQLDRYLVMLFEMRSDYATPDALDGGAEVFFQLYTHSRKAILQEGEGTSQEFINDHPLPFQEETTKTAVYAAWLSGEHLSKAAIGFLREQNNGLGGKCDIIFLDELYQRLCAFLGREEDMARLNDLFSRCFLPITSLTAFVEGYVTELTYALLGRDPETDHTVLQILLDRQES